MRPWLVGALTVATLAIVVGDGSAQQPSPTPSPTPAPVSEQQAQACDSSIGDHQSQREHFRLAGVKIQVTGRVASGRISLRVKMRGKAIKKKFSLSFKGNLKQEPIRSKQVKLIKRFRRHVRHRGVQVKWTRNVVGRGVCLSPDGGVWNFNVYFKWHGGRKTKKAHAFLFFPVRPLIPPSTTAPQPSR